MGLFSTKKKVYVASTVYKMIDDGTDRATFMKETVANTVLSNNPNASLADAIVYGLNNGPRSLQRKYFQWCKNNYDDGLPRAVINYTETINETAVAAEILQSEYGGDTNNEITIVSSFIDTSDESFYAERWVMENREDVAHLDWAADPDPDTNDILIQWPLGTQFEGNPLITDTISEPGFDPSDQLLLAYYTVTNSGVTSPVKLFIYVLGSGNTLLDDRYVTVTDGINAREFYPIIPLRLTNKSVLDPASSAYPYRELLREAWRRSLGSELDDAIDQVEGNEDINDIDHCYLVHGVCLNTQDIAEKKYIFEFFRLLGENQTIPNFAFQDLQTLSDGLGYNPRYDSQGREKLNPRTLSEFQNDGDGLIEGRETATYQPAPQMNEVHLTLPNPDLGNLDMKISWSDIEETQKTGLINYGAKKGDIDISINNIWEQTVELKHRNINKKLGNPVNQIAFRKQISSTEYIEIIVSGLYHKNRVYKKKSVEISGSEALKDEDDSGFIIPLHEPTLRRVGGVAATDVARESYLLVFNSYQIVKKKWYQTGFFKFLLAVVIAVVVAVVSFYTAGAGTPAAASAGAGILGSAATVGAALGFTGIMAIAVGAAANAIAAMLVLQMISVAGSELFGEKIGRILTAVAAVVLVLGTGPDGFSFAGMENNIANLAALDRLALMTNAAADIVGAIQQDQLNDILAATRKQTEEYEKEMAEIEELIAKFGFNDPAIIDPMMLTDISDPLAHIKEFGSSFVSPSSFGEMPQDFLDRTLLTGGDLIDISHAMVTDFVNATLTLK